MARKLLRAPVKPPSPYQAPTIDIADFWGPKSRQPTVVVAQVDFPFDNDKNGIHPVDHEPYIRKLLDTLRFAQRQKADFCVFPEYAVPLAAAQRVLNAIRKADDEQCVYILPFEHMNVRAYFKLMQKFGVSAEDQKAEEKDVRKRLTATEEETTVNAAMIVVRSGQEMRVFPQRKLRPAKLEEPSLLRSRFLTGDSIRIVRGRDCSFAVMICFDFIALDDRVEARPRDILAGEQLDLLFVPECNPSPLHDFYLKSMIDLYQAPAWSSRRPMVIMVNVGIGTRIGRYRFGFSRMMGEFGKVPELLELRRFKGYVAKENPRSLSDLDETVLRVRDDYTHTLIFRPEQSIFVCELPPLGRPAKGRDSKDVDTNVFIYRPIGKPEEWKVVRERPPVAAATAARWMLSKPLEETQPAATSAEKLRKRILSATPLVFVRGAGGAGKTALVATTLDKLLKRQDKRQQDRVIWIDLADIDRSEEALIEKILLELHMPGELVLPLPKQYDAIRLALETWPTVLVIDSAHLWGEPLPPDLLALHGWKTLLVITSRSESWKPETAQTVTVERLTLRDFAIIVKSIARQDPPPFLTAAMHTSSQGSALQAAWTGELVARNRAEADHLNRYIEKEIGPRTAQTRAQVLKAGAKRGITRRRGAEQPIVQTSEDISLRIVDQWLRTNLTKTALDLLAVVSALPAGLRVEDLKKIVGHQIVAEPMAKLESRNLVQVVRPSPDADHTTYTSHPFARQVWQANHGVLDDAIFAGIFNWAKWILGQYGRDREPKLAAVVADQWPNFARILEILGARTEEKDLRDFLAIWKLADGFLWAHGRWRERLKFGERAEAVARQLGDVESEITALYDARAKTLWHRYAAERRTEAEHLLARAAQLADTHDVPTLRARVEWYRARMLLHLGETGAALATARDAVEFANAARDAETRVYAHITLGNVYRESDEQPNLSLDQYDLAEEILNLETVDREDEIRGLLLRNRGRTLLRHDDAAAAIRLFEVAMDRFRDLKLIVQEARTAVSYAEALARIGEPWTGEQFLQWGRHHLDPLGFAQLSARMIAAQKAIDDAKQRGN